MSEPELKWRPASPLELDSVFGWKAITHGVKVEVCVLEGEPPSTVAGKCTIRNGRMYRVVEVKK